jgi:hypothetical protein
MKVVHTNPATPEHDPKLKMAAMEILEIMKKYDIAGVAHLHVPGFYEYVIHIEPSWSCVSLNETKQLKITPPLVDPNDEKVHKKKIADTVNMIANLKGHSGKLLMVLNQADMTVRHHFGMMPKPGGPRTPMPNNNGKQN